MGIRVTSNPNITREVQEITKGQVRQVARLTEKELKGPKSLIPVDTGFLKSTADVDRNLRDFTLSAKYASYVNRAHPNYFPKALRRALARAIKKVNRG